MIEPNKTDDMAENTKAQGSGRKSQDDDVNVSKKLDEANKLLHEAQERFPVKKSDIKCNMTTSAKCVSCAPEDSLTLTSKEIHFNYLGRQLKLSDIEDRKETEKAFEIKEMEKMLRKLGICMFSLGGDLLSCIQEPSGRIEEEWIANDVKHPWLKESDTALKVKERTEDMEIRIKQLEEAELIYTMKEGGTKMCLIIGNSTFNKLHADLPACEIDCRYLKALFEGLNFVVDKRENLTAKEIETFLEVTKRHLDDVECFACVITSHGDPTGVLGSDEQVVEFQAILNMFDRDHCHELKNKPKLFLFDVCRGSAVDQMKAIKIVDHTMIPPTKSDILVAHATTNNYASFSDRNYGSWFCRSFVKVVSENACRYSILDMLLMVNKLVGTFASKQRDLQSAQFDCSMRKQFFFPLPVISQANAIAANETNTSLEEDRR